jgi:hypothetical protein
VRADQYDYALFGVAGEKSDLTSVLFEAILNAWLWREYECELKVAFIHYVMRSSED